MDKKNQRSADKQSAEEKKENVQAISIILTTSLFFGIIVTLALVTSLSQKSEFSETQNRYLASFPKFSVKKVYNGSYTDGIEDYLSDHFAAHDSWIKAKTQIELAAGKQEQNGIYILRDRLVEKIAEPDMTAVKKNTDAIKLFAEENKVLPFVMLVPTQAEIYRDELPANAPNPNQQTFINEIYDSLGEWAAPIDVYSTLSANRSDYIYYRTDHHWTTLGAYLGYSAAGKKLGYTPLSRDEFDIEHAGNGFQGTFYSKVLYDGIEKDTLDLWLPTEDDLDPILEIYTDVSSDPVLHDGFYFREFLDKKDKYSTFLGSNQPVVTIKTGRPGDKLLLFKDSYSHCMIPFLSQHYSEITMVDMRYIQISYKEIIDVSEYDSVLFLYNVSTFMSDENIKKLAM